jgi:phosphoribosyl-AMP cyclohydrolase
MIEPDFEKGEGLVPAVVQDYKTGEVLMVAYMNRESWLKTLETKKAHYWSRSRNCLWLKGETSGHFQIVREVRIDCDEDTVLLKVDQIGGAACHTGHRSCFYRRMTGGDFVVVGEKVFNPEEVYK